MITCLNVFEFYLRIFWGTNVLDLCYQNIMDVQKKSVSGWKFQVPVQRLKFEFQDSRHFLLFMENAGLFSTNK